MRKIFIKLCRNVSFLLIFCFLFLAFNPLTVNADDDYSEGGVIEFGHWPYQYSENVEAVEALSGKDRGLYEYNGGYYYVTSKGSVSDTYPITWKILNVGAGILFLIQEYVYVGYNYDSSLIVDFLLSYDSSDLRSYLNDTYMYYFTEEEKAAMLALTGDNMFIPSQSDLQSFLPSESDRIAHYHSYQVPNITTPMTGFGTAWAYNKSAETCAYWTSTIQAERIGAKQPTYVDCDGVFREGGRVYYTWNVGVRPMMYIDTSKIPCKHEYGEWTVTNEPTCTEAGSRQKACGKCGKTATEAIDELGHEWGEWETTKEPTETETGTKSAHVAAVMKPKQVKFQYLNMFTIGEIGSM